LQKHFKIFGSFDLIRKKIEENVPTGPKVGVVGVTSKRAIRSNGFFRSTH